MLNNNINSNSEELSTLRNLVKLKNIVSQFIWFTLTGILTILTSYSYIIKLKCSLTNKKYQKIGRINRTTQQRNQAQYLMILSN